jgi:hypothetical protein
VEKSTELDLEDGLADARVLDLPEDVNDENAFESHQSEAEKLAEEAAFALSKKPLDEILAEGLGIPEHEIEDDDDEVHEEITEEETRQEADLKVTTNEIQNDQQDAEIEVPEKSDENDLEQTDEFSERLESSLDPDIDDSDLDDEANPVKK